MPAYRQDNENDIFQKLGSRTSILAQYIFNILNGFRYKTCYIYEFNFKANSMIMQIWFPYYFYELNCKIGLKFDWNADLLIW